MKLNRLSIATKLTIFTIMLIGIFSAFLGWFFIQHEIIAIKAELNERANTIARNLAYNSEYSVLVGDKESLTHLIDGVLNEKDIVNVTIESNKGEIIVQAGEKGKEPAKEFSAPIITKLFPGDGVELTSTTKGSDEQTIGIVRLGISLSGLYRKSSELIRLISTIMIIVVCISTLGVIMGIRFFITRPLIPLLSTIKKFGEGNLTKRAEVKTNDEIAELARSFNKMAADLSKTVVSKTFVDNIIRSMIDTLIVVNPKGIIKTVNQATTNLLGYREEELVGKLVDILFAEQKFSEQKVFADLLREGYVNNIEKTYLTKDGTKIPILFSGSAMYNSNGELEGIVFVALDITERKRIEQELITARQDALQASRAKSEFLTSMSHEIRTPMNAIIGMADLLGDTPLSREQKQYVHVFKSAGENLLEIINNILDVSKIETGHIELEKIDFDLNELIEKICETLAVRAHTKGLEISFHIMPDVSTNLNGDPNRLRQILVNLLGNAIKFTEQGEVVLKVEHDHIAQEPGALLFSVTDTGIGIPQDKIEMCFDTFTQVDSSTTRKYGGSGLGLTISKRFVELMKGKIWAESKVGKGSTFYFTALFDVQTGPPHPASLPVVDLKGFRILVVDDNATNRFILNEILKNWGIIVTDVDSGERALAELRRIRKTNDYYKLVLLDSCMPDMDGFAVAEQIKKDPELATTTIMMLTSARRKGDITKCQKLGIVSYLIKPVKKSELLEAIRSVLGKTHAVPQEQLQTEAAVIEDKRALKILLIEDTPDNRFLIQAYLKKMPYQIDNAENGQEAVEKFKTEKYDLILMDMQMPVMDGYTATRIIRAIEKENGLAPTPIIALTAYALKEEVQKSLDAGCNAHLTKPIKKQKLIEAIINYTEVKKDDRET